MHLFDIIGPVMIGPSSSHTAGAARIGRVTRQLLGGTPARADIGLTGSFLSTYEGHGTDRAVIGGLLGFAVDDDRLRDSMAYAREAQMRFTFSPRSVRGAHPNTLLIDAWLSDGRGVSVRAASIGGGRIFVDSLDGLEVGFSGEAVTLIIRHRDTPGAIARVSRVIAEARLNIASMRVFRQSAGGDAIMAIELDARPESTIVSELETLASVSHATLLDKI